MYISVNTRIYHNGRNNDYCLTIVYGYILVNTKLMVVPILYIRYTGYNHFPIRISSIKSLEEKYIYELYTHQFGHELVRYYSPNYKLTA